MSRSGRAEAALEQAEARAHELELLLDRVADTVLVVDRAGAILSGHGGGNGVLRPRRPRAGRRLLRESVRAGRPRAAAAQLAARRPRGRHRRAPS